MLLGCPLGPVVVGVPEGAVVGVDVAGPVGLAETDAVPLGLEVAV
jgi:hypothetical protein